MKPTFKYIRYRVFGWLVHQKKLEINETFTASVTALVARNKVDNITLWTKGLIRIFDDKGEFYIDRVPGTFSPDLPDPKVGSYTAKAIEASEWWCVNHAINKRKFPKISPARIIANGSLALKRGQGLLVCSGEALIGNNKLIPGGQVVARTKDAVVSSTMGFYGLIFEGVGNV